MAHTSSFSNHFLFDLGSMELNIRSLLRPFSVADAEMVHLAVELSKSADCGSR